MRGQGRGPWLVPTAARSGMCDCFSWQAGYYQEPRTAAMDVSEIPGIAPDIEAVGIDSHC